MPIRSSTTTLIAAIAASCLALTGCGSSSSARSSDGAARDNVGVYDAPPAGIERLAVGVPPFRVDQSAGDDSTASVAADQLTTLAFRTQRFDVIERAQLDQILAEQELEGIVNPDELAAMGEVRGVDLLFLGRVTNFRVTQSNDSGGVGLGRVQLPGGGSLGAFDVSSDTQRITVDIGVDIRLVDPSSGETVAAQFAEFSQTDSSSGFGIDILGASADSDANLSVDADNRGKLLRLALDDALRQMLPSIDAYLVAEGG